MKRARLPLTALRAFEAAGRHLSFSRAAEELFVSQAAISRQIRELEEQVGRALFERRHRQVVLTAGGAALLEQLTASFDAMETRLAQVAAQPAQDVLRVSVEPGFAGALLIPRLPAFRAAHPDIDVAVESDPRLVTFRAHEPSVAIRYAMHTPGWPRAEMRPLFEVSLVPVAAPSLLDAGPPIDTPADLGRHTLLHDANRDAWARWFNANGLPQLAIQRGPIYDDATLVMQAARLGHGIALGDRAMERDDLAARRLVQVCDVEVPGGSYWIVVTSFRRLGAAATAFVAWAEAEFSDTNPRLRGPSLPHAG